MAKFKITIGYNDIATTAPWMVKYLKNKEDAYSYACKSNKKIWFTCPICGNEKCMRICDFYKRGICCPKCGDKTPYPEKIMFNVLCQLNIEFKYRQYFDWVNNKEYDFYIQSLNTIVETHGRQHYEEQRRKSNRTKSLIEEQANDKLKKELALTNGIRPENYIVIDCRKSELEFIKQNILNSNLNKLFDLNKIDWLKCQEFACSSRVKEACDLWNSGIKNAINIGTIMNLSDVTITKYLHKGKELNWCIDYDSKKILSERSRNIGLANGKQVEIFKGGFSLGIFPSCAELERKSLKLFGVKLNQGHISDVCIGRRKQHQGYTFRYVELKEAC